MADSAAPGLTVSGERGIDLPITDDTLTVRIMDGRSNSLSLEWYPRLAHASRENREQCEISGADHVVTV